MIKIVGVPLESSCLWQRTPGQKL